MTGLGMDNMYKLYKRSKAHHDAYPDTSLYPLAALHL